MHFIIWGIRYCLILWDDGSQFLILKWNLYSNSDTMPSLNKYYPEHEEKYFLCNPDNTPKCHGILVWRMEKVNSSPMTLYLCSPIWMVRPGPGESDCKGKGYVSSMLDRTNKDMWMKDIAPLSAAWQFLAWAQVQQAPVCSVLCIPIYQAWYWKLRLCIWFRWFTFNTFHLADSSWSIEQDTNTVKARWMVLKNKTPTTPVFQIEGISETGKEIQWGIVG